MAEHNASTYNPNQQTDSSRACRKPWIYNHIAGTDRQAAEMNNLLIS